ncbi:MAG: hypothetical protein E7K04_00545 [Helicobacter sp.]|nr:hypothetical protein [Helicobacter sp.]
MKNLLKQQFIKAKNSYKENALIQQKMQDILLSHMLKIVPKKRELIFEFGAGFGDFSFKILEHFKADQIICNDILDLQIDGVIFKSFDMDNFLSFIDFKSDLVLSNAALQWLDPHYFCKYISKIMLNDGFLCFTTFGRDNLLEIRDICGFGLDYKSLDFYKSRLVDFELLSSFERHFKLNFDSPTEVFKHLKLTGVSAIKRANITKKMLLDLQNKYQNSITYHCIFVIAKLTR